MTCSPGAKNLAPGLYNSIQPVYDIHMTMITGIAVVESLTGAPDATDIEYSIMHAVGATLNADGVSVQEFRPNRYRFGAETDLEYGEAVGRLEEDAFGGETDDGTWETKIRVD